MSPFEWNSTKAVHDHEHVNDHVYVNDYVYHKHMQLN
jgi:hypothetical protein